MSNFYTLFAGILAYSWFELWNLASFLFIIWVLKNYRKGERVQSVNCLVHISRLPQFEIKKSGMGNYWGGKNRFCQLVTCGYK